MTSTFATTSTQKTKQNKRKVKTKGKHTNQRKKTLILIQVNHTVLPITTESDTDYDTYDILPKGANADLISSVVISGLKSPTNTWK